MSDAPLTDAEMVDLLRLAIEERISGAAEYSIGTRRFRHHSLESLTSVLAVFERRAFRSQTGDIAFANMKRARRH